MYILSNFLSSFPFVAMMSIATGTITYYMVKFRPEFSHLVYICLDLIGAIAVVESSMMIIASLVPNFLMGVIIGAGYIVRKINFIFYAELLPLQLDTNSLSLSGNYDDDCWVLQAPTRSSQAFLAVPNFIHQLWCMGNTGNFPQKKLQVYITVLNPLSTIMDALV